MNIFNSLQNTFKRKDPQSDMQAKGSITPTYKIGQTQSLIPKQQNASPYSLNTVKPSQPYQQPQPTSAPKSWTPIKSVPSYSYRQAQPQQTSGMTGSQFNSRWNQIKAKQDAAKAQLDLQADSQPTSMNDMMGRYDKYLADSQARREEIARQNAALAEQAAGAYDRQNEYLQGQIPGLQAGLDRYKSDAGNDITAERAATDKLKAAKETEYGAKQRALMENRRQLMGQREKQYAALGTIDSYGTGSFTQTNANDDTAFNRTTNENQMALQSAQDQADNDFMKYERTVKGKIADEESKFNETIRQINLTMGNNVAAKQQAIQAAKLELQQNLGNITDEYEGMKLQREQELAKQQADNQMPQLSEEFMAGGKPTMSDMLALSKYPQFAATYKAFNDGAGGAAGKVAAKDANIAKSGITAIGSLRNMMATNPGINNNPLSTNSVLGNQEYKATMTNLADLIGRLRSGGAIQKEEEARFRSLLPGIWDNPQAANYKLQQLENEFSSLLGGGMSANQQGNSNDPLGLGF